MISGKIDAIEKDLDLVLLKELRPEERSLAFAGFARKTLAEAQAGNAEILGRIPDHETYVDGRQGVREEAVTPNGVIIYEFNILDGVFDFVFEQLVKASPHKSGRYRQSFVFYADGQQVEPGGMFPPADEYVFMNTQPYSRKIERGASDQAREGVFQVTAAMAQRRFSNFAKVSFSFRSPINGAQSNIARIGPLRVMRDVNNPDRTKRGRFLKGSHTRAGNQAERMQRQPAITIWPR